MSSGSSKPSQIPLIDIRHATCLQHFTPMEMSEIFAAATEDNGTITRAAFEDCFAEIAGFVAAE